MVLVYLHRHIPLSPGWIWLSLKAQHILNTMCLWLRCHYQGPGGKWGRRGQDGWGRCRRKEKLLLPLLGFMGENSPLPTPALVATWRDVMGGHSSRQMSAPISIRPRALQWLYLLNTLPRLFNLGKTVGGEAKTFIMFKFCNRPFSVNQGSPTRIPLPCSSLQNCFCQSNIVFFNIHAFPSLTWLSWHSRHNFLPR